MKTNEGRLSRTPWPLRGPIDTPRPGRSESDPSRGPSGPTIPFFSTAAYVISFRDHRVRVGAIQEGMRLGFLWGSEEKLWTWRGKHPQGASGTADEGRVFPIGTANVHFRHSFPHSPEKRSVLGLFLSAWVSGPTARLGSIGHSAAGERRVVAEKIHFRVQPDRERVRSDA